MFKHGSISSNSRIIVVVVVVVAVIHRPSINHCTNQTKCLYQPQLSSCSTLPSSPPSNKPQPHPKQMCIRFNRTHSACHHAATGTAGLPTYLRYCAAALEASATAQRATPCTGSEDTPTSSSAPVVLQNIRANARFHAGAALEDRNETFSRPYCDACVKNGVELFIDRGLDPDVYARGMGVSLNALIREYPGWLD